MKSKEDKAKMSWLDKPHHFFFELYNNYDLPWIYYIILGFIEKVTILVPLILHILKATPWNGANSLIMKLNVLPFLLSGKDSTAINCYIALVIFHAFMVILIFQLFLNNTPFPLVKFILGIGIQFINYVLTHCVGAFTFYFLLLLRKGVTFEAYKGISGESVAIYSMDHIVLSVFISLTFLECILIDLLYILLYQDHQLTVWCLRPWYFKLVGLLVRIYIMAEFVLDSNDNYVGITGLGLLFLLSTRIFTRFMFPLSCMPYCELTELWFDICLFLLQFLIVISCFANVISLINYYQYVLAIPIYALAICILRFYLKTSVDSVLIKAQEDPLDYIRDLLQICNCLEESSLLKLCGLLTIHRKDCSKINCECADILCMKKLVNARRTALSMNYNAYESVNKIPSKMSEYWKLNALKLLLREVDHQANKTDNLCLTLAEISFYYFGNYYQAYKYVEMVEARRPNIQIKQSLVNMKRTIGAGLQSKSKEARNIIASLQFQEKYNTFLVVIDDACECTIKFWTALLDEKLDPSSIRKLGKELYEARCKFTKLTEVITAINENHAEFLVKLGLFMKLILHNKIGSDRAFHRLLWASENAVSTIVKEQTLSLFRNDLKIMMVEVSLEQNDFFQITECNNELESQLGYKREELIGFSGTKLMPPEVASQHQKFVHDFFVNMGSDVIGVEKLRFIQHQDGCLLPCRVSKRIVPSLNNGLRGIMFFYAHTTMLCYTSFKSDVTRKKYGAILYDRKERIIGITHKAKDLIGLHSEDAQTIKTNLLVTSVFPEMKNERIIERFKRPQGAIISHCFRNLETQFEEDDAGQTNEKIKKDLVWMRLVEEICGQEEILVLVFSLILEGSEVSYFPVRGFGNILFEQVNKLKVAKLIMSNSFRRLPINPTKKISTKVMAKDSKKSMNTKDTNDKRRSSQAQSVFSDDSKQKPTKTRAVSQRLQEESTSEETPDIIKKLTFALVVFLLVVFALISVESQKFYTEIEDLKNRFEMIEYFQIRQQIIYYLAASPYFYDSYRKGFPPSVLPSLCSRTQLRVERVLAFNIKTKQSFNKFKLNYDYDKIIIKEKGDTFTVSFDIAFLKYIEEVYQFSSVSDYNMSTFCITDNTNPVCVNLNFALDFVTSNGLYNMRENQLRVSNDLIKGLIKKASAGENELYTIIAICVGIVFLCSIFIVLILIWVIKDKSYVLSIFADITHEEVNKVIEYAKSTSIVKVRFSAKHVLKFADCEGTFWRSLLRIYRRKSDNVIKLTSINRSRIINNEVNHGNRVMNFEVKEEKSIVDNSNSPINSNPQTVIVQRKDMINKIDPELRNSSILKLGIILFALILYGIGSIYFNYFIHQFNESASYFFFELSKRNIYGIMLISLMRESVYSKNKPMLLRNPDSNGIMYTTDCINEMLKIEERVREYNKKLDMQVFSSYYDLSMKLDSNVFCQYVDSYNIGQSGKCNASYIGPKDQGLSAGMAFYIDYHIMFISKILGADFGNETALNDITIDPGFTSPGSSLITYLQPALELQLLEYRKDTVNFYNKVQIIMLSKLIAFILIFILIYLFVIMKLLSILKEEILLTRGMLQIIPMFILETNQEVQNQVWQRRYVA